MIYEYPNHFSYPESTRIFFLDHVPIWEKFLSDLKNRDNICLEIGSLYGGSSVYILENFCKTENSHLYVMDINDNIYLQNNLKPYKNVTKIIGESSNSFKSFVHQNLTKEFLDFVYIDGNHMSKYVLEDAVNSFHCLKEGGVMIFDDFGGGLEQPKHLQVKTGVDSFLYSYEQHVELIFVGYQLILKKINKVSIEDYKSNYYL